MFRTLLVEDCPSYRQTLQTMLQDRFPEIEVLVAGDGVEAWTMAMSHRPDLVFMDIKLPGESGLELTRRLKEHDANIRVVILTSYDLAEYRHAAAINGASGFLCKESTTPADIASLVQDTLSLHCIS